MVLPTFTPRASCFINEFLSALTSLFVRPHSSPVSRATETSRVQGRGQDKDKRRTGPGHRARPQRRRTRRGQEEEQGPATEPSHRGQKEDKVQEDKASTQSPGREDKRRTRPGHRAQPQRIQNRAQPQRTRPGHRAQPQSPATEFRSAASECGQLFFLR